MRIPLVLVAHARGGDKGDIADISLFAYDEAAYRLMLDQVTVERVAVQFEPLVRGPVERYALDQLLAIKFVLHGALDGGAACSLRSDNLGKSLAAGLLRLEVEWPDDVPVHHACYREYFPQVMPS